jgi:hypothetical protein
MHHFGTSWTQPASFEVAGDRLKLRAEPAKAEQMQFGVEFDAKGRITKLTGSCERAHPRCHEHRAAAESFLAAERPALAVGAVIYLDVVRNALPDHYLYEALESERAVGFVLVRKNVKECRFIDRTNLDGLPESLRSLLAFRK